MFTSIFSDFYKNYVFFFIVSGIILFYLKNYFRAVYLALTLPGPPAIPILGNVLTVADNKKLVYYSNNAAKLYGSIIRVWLSIIPAFYVIEPKYLQIVLGSNKVSEKNMFYTFLHNFLGEGLITNNGNAKWRNSRRLIQPYFHKNVLKTFFGAFTENATILLDRLSNVTDINITTLINRTVLEILYQSILGTTLEDFEDSPFRKGKVVVTDRAMKPWLLLESLFKMTKAAKNELQQKRNLQNFTRQVLEKKLAEDTAGTKPPTNLMEMLIKISREYPEFTKENIINEACTFMLAGQDSVGAATAFTLYSLAQHQDIQKKVVDELQEIFADNYDRNITFEDLLEMKYLEQCIKETMRLYPPVPKMARRLLQDVTLDNITIPAGTNLFISPFTTHRLPHIFENPLDYNPDRFSSERVSKLHPYAYIPFSAGPRNCIGYKFGILEVKVIVAEILRNFHLDLCPGHEHISLVYRVTIRAKGGIWLRLNKRKLGDFSNQI